jgi:hypothetical protein
MNWSKEYIEARILDAIEGRLSDDQLILLQQLLQEHPEFGSLEEDFSTLTVDSPKDIFPKELLLKEFPFTPKAFDSEEGEAIEKMAIAKMEGLLNEKEEQDFDQFLKVELVLQKEWEDVNQTILKPDVKVCFPNSGALLKESRIIPWRNYIAYTAAASILFFLYLGWPSQDPIVQAKSISKIKITPPARKNKPNQRIEKPIWTENTSSFNPISVKQVEPIKNEVPNCVIPDIHTESSSEIALNLPVEQQSSSSNEVSTINPVKNQPGLIPSTSKEVMGLKEFVVQKGNERLFGTPNPSASERYASIANYLAKSTNLPIDYEQSVNDKQEITYIRLGFISIERKRTKK